MKEWSVYKEASDVECIYGGSCLPNPKNLLCVDCYSEYVEGMTAKPNVKVYIKGGRKDAKDN